MSNRSDVKRRRKKPRNLALNAKRKIPREKRRGICREGEREIEKEKKFDK